MCARCHGNPFACRARGSALLPRALPLPVHCTSTPTTHHSTPSSLPLQERLRFFAWGARAGVPLPPLLMPVHECISKNNVPKELQMCNVSDPWCWEAAGVRAAGSGGWRGRVWCLGGAVGLQACILSDPDSCRVQVSTGHPGMPLVPAMRPFPQQLCWLPCLLSSYQSAIAAGQRPPPLLPPVVLGDVLGDLPEAHYFTVVEEGATYR